MGGVLFVFKKNHVRQGYLPELLWQLDYCQLIFWKQFFKSLQRKWEMLSQSAFTCKDYIFKVKRRGEEGKWFSMNNGIQSILQFHTVVECKFLIKEGPTQTSSKAFGSLPFHTASE